MALRSAIFITLAREVKKKSRYQFSLNWYWLQQTNLAIDLRNYDPALMAGATVTDTGENVNGNLVVTGTVTEANSITQYVPVAVNSTATLTAPQVAAGYITSTSGSATTMTLPTGTLLGAQLNARQGTTTLLYIDNTAGANTVTIAVGTNAILSAAAVAGSAAGAGLLTVPSGVTGVAEFTLMFSSATAYVFTRTA